VDRLKFLRRNNMAKKKRVYARFVAKGPSRRTSASYGAQTSKGRGMMGSKKKKMMMD